MSRYELRDVMHGLDTFKFDSDARDLEFDERELEMLEQADDSGEWPDDIGGEAGGE